MKNIVFILLAASIISIANCLPNKQDADSCMRKANTQFHCGQTDQGCLNDYNLINSCIDNSDNCRIFYQQFNSIGQLDTISDKGQSCFKDCVSNTKITNEGLIKKYNQMGDCLFGGIIGFATAIIALLLAILLI